MTSSSGAVTARSGDGTPRRLPSWILVLAAGAVLLVVTASGFAYWRFVCCYGVAERAPQLVDDLPPYGEELRALPPYGDSPSKSQEYRPGTPAYAGEGYYVRWSLDRSVAAVTTDAANSYHTVKLWDEARHILTPVITIKEADPGSGIAHRYVWSGDSKALLIYGEGALRHEASSRRLCLVYLPARDVLYGLRRCP